MCQSVFACRLYKTSILRQVTAFLTAVQASLVKLGVDENRMKHISQEVGPQLSACLRATMVAACSSMSPHLSVHDMLTQTTLYS